MAPWPLAMRKEDGSPRRPGIRFDHGGTNADPLSPTPRSPSQVHQRTRPPPESTPPCRRREGGAKVTVERTEHAIWVGARPGPMLQRGRAETITLARGAEDGHYGALLSCTEQRPQRGGAARPQVNHSSDRVKRLPDSSSNTVQINVPAMEHQQDNDALPRLALEEDSV
ncbi:unnamed protein product [Gadus morhua 'NCC']